MSDATEWTEDGRLRVNGRIAIPPHELELRASRAGGPGGQHVNTSSTRVEATWCVTTSGALDEASRTLLLEKLSSRLDSTGTLRVVAADTRSQAQNRALALQRLASTVAAALVIPKKRRPTKPTRSSKVARLETKKRRSTQKRNRRWKPDD